MLSRQKYVCPSKSCRREIEIELSLGGVAGEITSPTCTCGSKMKKPYTTPVLFSLNRTKLLLPSSEIEGLQASHRYSNS